MADTAMDVDPHQGVFSSVTFTIIEGSGLAPERAQEVRRACSFSRTSVLLTH